MFGWSSNAAHQAAAAAATHAPAPAPRAHVFSTDHMHVHYAEHFLEALEKAMELPVSAFRIVLTSIEELGQGDDLVSVASVIRMAKLMSTFASLQTVYAAEGAAHLHLMLEIGKTLHLIQPQDKVVVFSGSALANEVLTSAGVTCVDLRSQYVAVFMQRKLLR